LYSPEPKHGSDGQNRLHCFNHGKVCDRSLPCVLSRNNN
jgi:hypothetical protein